MAACRHRKIRFRHAGVRAAAYARLEQIRFRTGMTVLAGVAAVLGGTAAAVIMTVSGGPPAKAPPLARHAPLAAPPPLPRPRPAFSSSRPGTPRRQARGTSAGGNDSYSTAPRPARGVPPSTASAGLTAAPDPANPGQSVTYTITVSPATTTGRVVFADRGDTIPGCGQVPLSSGTARCQARYSRTGTHAITATYHPRAGPVDQAPAVGETIANCGRTYQGCKLLLADLQNADLHGDNLQSAALQSADLAGADLAGARLQNANLAGADLAGAGLQNADLAGATLTGATLAGVTWSSTTCPDGTNSNNDNKTCQHNL